MYVCRQCGQELIEYEINNGIDICSECILENSTKSAIKFSVIYCFITMVSIMFVANLFPIIINFSLGLMVENFEYIFINLVIFIITGGTLVIFITYSISRRVPENKPNINSKITNHYEI
jgi:uncharacterized paraquat-inducible protein A